MKLAIEHLDQIRTALAERGGHRGSMDLARAPLLPPVVQPGTFRDFYAFEQHVARCRAKRGLPMEPAWYEQPAFYFSNPVALVGHEAPVHAPHGSRELDYELELGLIVGRPGRDIPQDCAWDYVAGLTIINDFSARDLQRREMAVGLGPAKGKDFATAVGPCLVTLDELRDRIDDAGKLHLRMTARVNGTQLSQGDAASMYFTWPRIIEHASRDAELLPGDLLGSGTVGTGCILELGRRTPAAGSSPATSSSWRSNASACCGRPSSPGMSRVRARGGFNQPRPCDPRIDRRPRAVPFGRIGSPNYRLRFRSPKRRCSTYCQTTKAHRSQSCRST